jgi:hypothetical protein
MDKESELAKIRDFLVIDDNTREKLLKIDDLKFLKILSPLILLAYLDRELSKINDSIVLTTFYISTIEAVQSVMQGKIYKGKYKLISAFLKNTLSVESKIDLLINFTFSKKYEFRKDRSETFHLMREAYVSSISNSYETPDKYCFTGDRPECQCVKWLRENEGQIDTFIEKLSLKFYQMRNAVFHDGSGVIWIHDFENTDNGSGTLFDAYSVDEANFISYSSGMNKIELHGVIKSGFEKFLSDF